MSTLAPLGWGPFFSSQLTEAEASSLLAGRVVADGAALVVRFEDGDRAATLPARLRAPGAAPVAGDFVLATPGPAPSVVRVLDRRTRLSRNAAGRAVGEQVLAANVDLVLLVQGLDGDFNARRLERTLAAIWSGGAEPVVLLTKADLVPDPQAWVAEAEASAPGVHVVAVSSTEGIGLDQVRALLAPGRTAVLAGSSGAGKSTLVNALLGGEVQATAPVAPDGRGRHTTTSRRLIELPGGGLLLDGPGLRELQLWDGAGVARAFEDVEAVAASCRFRDCRHDGEPGCAVREAVEAGTLEAERVESLRKLEGELERQLARRSGADRLAERRRGREIAQALEDLRRLRGR